MKILIILIFFFLSGCGEQFQHSEVILAPEVSSVEPTPEITSEPPGPELFTWEGELDPNEFDKWIPIDVRPNPQGSAWVFAENPDRSSPIKVVALIIIPSGALLGYRYFKYGEPHSFIFDVENNKYVREELTSEQRSGCIKCHDGSV